MSGSPLSPTIALQRSKSSASVNGEGHIETPGTCAFNIHYLQPAIDLSTAVDIACRLLKLRTLHNCEEAKNEPRVIKDIRFIEIYLHMMLD